MAKKILVVDDEQELVNMMKLRLAANKYEVITANDGKEGLEKWKAEQPDLILLDIMMPEMDGYTFIQESKTYGGLNAAPIVVLTAKVQMEDLFKIEGVKDYILKPFSDENLMEIIEKHIGE